MVYQGLDFGIIMGRVLILYTKGLRYFRNIWDVGRNDILRFTMTFGLSCWNFTDPSIVERLDKVLTLLHVNGLVCIETQRMHYLNGWSLLVTSRNLAYEHVHFSAKFMSTFLKSTVGSQYFTLTKVQSNTKNATPPMIFSWWTSHVRVDRRTNTWKWPYPIQLVLWETQSTHLGSCTLVVAGGCSFLCLLCQDGEEMDYYVRGL